MPGVPHVPTVAVLTGSPRRANSARVAQAVSRGAREAGAEVRELAMGDYAFSGCTGCGACARTGRCVLDAREAGGQKPGHAALAAELLRADALALVAPVYFAGPPSQLKAAFDRLQPLWAQRYVLNARPALPVELRKPLDLFVLGGGGDPFGHDALVACARSALRMADFELRAVHDLVGFEAVPALQPRMLDGAFEQGAVLARTAWERLAGHTDHHPED